MIQAGIMEASSFFTLFNWVSVYNQAHLLQHYPLPKVSVRVGYILPRLGGAITIICLLRHQRSRNEFRLLAFFADTAVLFAVVERFRIQNYLVIIAK
jgi:hypothetical protein